MLGSSKWQNPMVRREIRGYMTQKENAFQPLNMPDLEDIVNEAGEDGLQMSHGMTAGCFPQEFAYESPLHM